MSVVLSEFEIVARYFAPLAHAWPGAYGLLDDAAVISPAPGNELVVKTDAIVSGVDFPAETTPDLIARKALRVNLSDLAAKGARPRAYLLDLIVPGALEEAWFAEFAAGLARDQREYGVTLIGGDTSSTPGPIVVAVSAFGEARAGRIIRRGGAQPGDALFVTGTVGDAALGLGVLQGTCSAISGPSASFLVDRYRIPQPRVGLGPALVGLATAAIDVSDGLVADLRHLCEVSQVDAVIDAELVPLSPAAQEAIAGDSGRLIGALTGGDDYELLFSARPGAMESIRELSRSLGVPITRIGQTASALQAGKPHLTVRDAAGRPLAFAAEGWTHFGGAICARQSPA